MFKFRKLRNERITIRKQEVVLVLYEVSSRLLSSQDALTLTAVDVRKAGVAGVRHFGDVGAEQPELEGVSQILN